MEEKRRKKLEARGVSIEFPGVKALADVDFSIEAGDIRAVVGANGAGKSTLMKILAGANPGYTGQLYYDGEPVEIKSPQKAKELGIEIVYQEVDMALFPSQTVAENVMMNRIIFMKNPIMNWKEVNRQARETLDRLNIQVDVNKLVGELTLAEKQMVLIARAVSEHCSFLILDEPTAPLSVSETKELFRIVKGLMEHEDIGVLFISHRLNEVLEICKTIDVMRNGKMVGQLKVEEGLTSKTVVDMMLGRSFEENFPKLQVEVGEVALEVKNLSDTEGMVKEVSFTIRSGEIIGISGLVGAGKTELCKLLFGDRKKKEGELLLHGKEIKIKSSTDAVRAGLGLVPEERRKEGVLVDEPVYFNLSAASLNTYSNLAGFVNKKAELEHARVFIESLGIKTPSELQLVRYLSGGNQQKVAVGKWIGADCEIYIFDEPTKGVDVGAKRDIFNLIGDIAKSGKSVIYATSEISEILAITDRTYVMYSGRIAAELETEKTTEEEIMYYSTGGQ